MTVINELINIVGKDRVSENPEELYIYARDAGAQPPGHADYVVLPKTPEEIRNIVLLANS